MLVILYNVYIKEQRYYNSKQTTHTKKNSKVIL